MARAGPGPLPPVRVSNATVHTHWKRGVARRSGGTRNQSTNNMQFTAAAAAVCNITCSRDIPLNPPAAEPLTGPQEEGVGVGVSSLGLSFPPLFTLVPLNIQFAEFGPADFKKKAVLLCGVGAVHRAVSNCQRPEK